MIAPQNADQKPATWKPSTNDATAQKRSALITRMKRPRVRIVTGRVSRTRTGRMIALTSPSTSATTSAVTKSFTWIELRT